MSYIPGTNAWAFNYWGDCRAGSPPGTGYEREHITLENFCGVTLRVDKRFLPQLRHFENRLKAEVPGFVKQLDDVRDDWGYAFRPIAGTSVYSNHSWGIAIDLNAVSEARGTRGNMPPKVVEIADHIGLRWGGHYVSSSPDPMHFESLLTPDEIRKRWHHDGTPKVKGAA